MIPGSSNRHHGVPRSFTGSDDDFTNLTTVDEQEHMEFHRMAGHVPPDFFVRNILLSSVDWRNAAQHGLPVGFYRDAIAHILHKDWRSAYQEEAIATPTDAPGNAEHFAKASIHIHNHVHDELYMAADAIAYCRNGSYIHPASRGYLAHTLHFFGASDPALAVRRFLIDTTTRGELKWAKPLLPSVRSRLLDATKYARPEHLSRKNIDQLSDVLYGIRQQLSQVIGMWEPRTEDYKPLMLERLYQRFFFDFLRSA